MVQKYRFEIWSRMPGENPSQDADDWKDGVPFFKGDKSEFIVVSGMNFASYNFPADTDNRAMLIGKGYAFTEDWMKDGSDWRLFRQESNENWLEVSR